MLHASYLIRRPDLGCQRARLLSHRRIRASRDVLARGHGPQVTPNAPGAEVVQWISGGFPLPSPLTAFLNIPRAIVRQSRREYNPPMYRRAVFAFVSVAAAKTICAQLQPASTADLLSRFQATVKETLRRLPDYTCIETVTRSRRTPPSTHFQPLDTIRLQVGLIGGHERYSWPDAARFDDRELRDLVGRGIIGTGNFAAHVHHVFLSAATQFTPHGADAFHERPAARFEYEVPVE